MKKKQKTKDHPVMKIYFNNGANTPSGYGLSIWSTNEIRLRCLGPDCPAYEYSLTQTPRQLHESLITCPAANDCSILALKLRGQAKHDNFVQANGSLQYHHPGLAAEWMVEKNDYLLPSDIAFRGGRSEGWWHCTNIVIDPKDPRFGLECGFEWYATARDRIKLKSNCRACSRAAQQLPHIQKARSLIIDSEILSKEYDTEQNGPMETSKIFMDTPLVWNCHRRTNHKPWKATLKDRISGKNGDDLIIRTCKQCCTSSNPRVQRALTRVIKEALGIEAQDEEEICNYEPDCYLPKYKAIIEYDGRFHNKDKDTMKDQQWSAAGYLVLRLRDESLPRLTGTGSVTQATPELSIDELSRCTRDLGLLLLNLPLKKSKHSLVKRLAQGRLLTEKQMIRYMATPIDLATNKSAAVTAPWLLKYIRDDQRHLLKEYSEKANIKVCWVCPLCKSQYKISIANRVRNYVCNDCKYVLMHSPNKKEIKKWIRCPAGTGAVPKELV
ncbi:DUF559 domain-containing protein [Marinobacter salinisoli]|uniref:DUF559 domain-containing protein n=1 Tax=Marinobacter salinisoli TaxID=2769486 RepID=A0ABX7MNZ0_9GAMM|nr:zinc-ribbon domain-containing protein [Marinobacter salinisoli]QSP94002.1 DUF559 domain-containing protein [Marinobacter salinisoli]